MEREVNENEEQNVNTEGVDNAPRDRDWETKKN